ncbi:MAG: prepilin-type N-terminal cleavage/methylation domain-containing protein [Planctomycetota bacterium]|nr:prepilin-type N-terminal cleavage/methylation domain-containing protein [Planctomycetota bacterium]
MRPNHAVRSRGAFTLVELIVTICIIGLLTAISMPALIQLFRSGADTQAYNVVSVELTNARSYAMQNNCYGGVHFQVRANGSGVFYCAVVAGTRKTVGYTWDGGDASATPPRSAHWVLPPDPGTVTFGLAAGYQLQELPGNIAVGQVDGFASETGFSGDFSDTNMGNFTTSTVVFNPSGGVVKSVKGGKVLFATDATDVDPRDLARVVSTPLPAPKVDPTYFKADAFSDTATGAYWTLALANGGADGRDGVTAITLFEYKVLAAYAAADRTTYLDQFAQILPVNLYTGQLYDRK